MNRNLSVTLEWKGPFTDESNIPNRALIYMVLSGRKNEKDEFITDLYKILDIGQTGEARTRIATHDREACWERNKAPNHTICYKYALMPSDRYDETDRRIVECCLRSNHKPPCGTECNEGYNRTDIVAIKNTGNRLPLEETYTCQPPRIRR